MRNVSEIKRTRYSVVFHLEQSANGIESEELCRIKKKIKKKKYQTEVTELKNIITALKNTIKWGGVQHQTR